jgi:undecaprenyl-diphosphatase
MSPLQSIVLGLIQGVTEFLPVSSSAHLVIVPWFAAWPDQGLAYDIALHWGTLLSLLVYFRTELVGFARAATRGKDSPERRLAFGLVLATVPGAAAGLLFEDLIETLFREPERIAFALAAFGLLLGAADRLGAKKLSVKDLTWKTCLFVGCAQALAIMPGVSRSGITLTAALIIGLRRVDAARFAFLMAIPIVLGAGILKVKDLAPTDITTAFWLGIAVSAISGYAAIRFLIRFLEARSLQMFAAYRVILAIFIFVMVSADPPIKNAKQLDLIAPSRAGAESLSPTAARLRRHVEKLAGEIGDRGIGEPAAVEAAREYVHTSLQAMGYDAVLDPYPVRLLRSVPDDTDFFNVVASTGPHPSPSNPLWVIGAHYDTHSGTPGADDNASGIAVLLEVAERLAEEPGQVPVRFVAYAAEEPPAFGTRNMGSAHDARRLRERNVPVAGMISLEMLGYYDERSGSQTFAPFTRWFLPDRGNFVAAAANLKSRDFLRKIEKDWTPNPKPPLIAAALPEVQLLRLSDHANYWDEGFPAVMLTDTAFLRNPNYHELSDTPDTLDYEAMAGVAKAVARVLRVTKGGSARAMAGN